jgi:hypothetical protein
MARSAVRERWLPGGAKVTVTGGWRLAKKAVTGLERSLSMWRVWKGWPWVEKKEWTEVKDLR